METAFLTVGESGGPLPPLLRAAPPAGGLVAFHDAEPGPARALAAAAAECIAAGIPFEAVPIDVDDMMGAVVAIRRRLETASVGTRRCHVAGGSKALTNAALLACMLEGVPVVVVSASGSGVAVPLYPVRYEEHLSQPQRKMLRLVLDHPGCAPSELARWEGVTRSTVAHHLGFLSALGLITVHADVQDMRRERVFPATGLGLVLGERRSVPAEPPPEARAILTDPS